MSSTRTKEETLPGNTPMERTLAILAEVRALASMMTVPVGRRPQEHFTKGHVLSVDIAEERLSTTSVTSCSTVCTKDDEEDSNNIPGSHAVCPTPSNSLEASPVSSDLELDIDYHFNNEEEYSAASQLMITTQRLCNNFLGSTTSDGTYSESIDQDEAWFRACSKLAPGEYSHSGYKYDSEDFMENGPLPYVDHTLKQGIFSDHAASVDSPGYDRNGWTSRVSTPSPFPSTNEASSVSSRPVSTEISSTSCSDTVSSSSSSVYSREDCKHDLEQAKDSLTRLLSDMGIRRIEFPTTDPSTDNDIEFNADHFSKYMDKNGNFDFFIGTVMIGLPRSSELHPYLLLAQAQAQAQSPSNIAWSNPPPPDISLSRETPRTLGSSVPTTPFYSKKQGKRLRRDSRSVAIASCRSTSDSLLIYNPLPPPRGYGVYEEDSPQEIAWRQQVEQCRAAGTGLRPVGHTLGHGAVTSWSMPSIPTQPEKTPAPPRQQDQYSPRSPPAELSQHHRSIHIKPRHDTTTIYQHSSPFHIPPHRPYSSSDTDSNTNSLTSPSPPPSPYTIRFTRRKNLHCNPNERMLHYPPVETTNAFSAIWNTMCLDRGKQTEFGPGCGESIYGMDEVEEQRTVWRGLKALANRRDEEWRAEKAMVGKEERGKKEERRGRLERIKGILRLFRGRGKAGKDRSVV